jgi:trimeric autotransporter adhesin
MWRHVALMALGAAAWGCGDPGITPPPPPPPPSPPPTLSVNSLSPSETFALSPDITVTITGATFEGLRHRHSEVVWQRYDTTFLATTFVSETLLTAVIPAKLLHDAGYATLFVRNVDLMDESGTPPPESNRVVFYVVPWDPSFSVAPAAAAAGSGDVTITVQGTGFHNRRHDWSNVVLSVNGSDNWLATTFISSSQLTAIIPAALLTNAAVGLVYVWTGDPMGDLGGSKEGAANFTVAP